MAAGGSSLIRHVPVASIAKAQPVDLSKWRRISISCLPAALQNSIDCLVYGYPRKILRQDCRYLFQRLHPLKTVAPGAPTGLWYGGRESVAFAATQLPFSYALIERCLSEIADRFPTFEPKSVLDFGCGPGTALWAADAVWPSAESQLRYTGIDVSEEMIGCAEQLLSQSKSTRAVLFQRFLPITPKAREYNLTIACQVLQSITDDRVFQSTVASLWDQTKDFLVGEGSQVYSYLR